MKIYNYGNKKYKIIQIWKYTNVQVEKCRCEKCKRVYKESQCIYIYIKL